ncbi:MAG: hypothetical protein R2849_22005 [Thermomicrobiales bacterium]
MSGQPASGWNAGVTSLALVAIATAALDYMGLARVQEIRDRNTARPARERRVENRDVQPGCLTTSAITLALICGIAAISLLYAAEPVPIMLAFVITLRSLVTLAA